MITKKAIEAFGSIRTPFYYYDMDLLKETLKVLALIIAEALHHASHPQLIFNYNNIKNHYSIIALLIFQILYFIASYHTL